MVLVVGAPVLIALLLRVLVGLGAPMLEDHGPPTACRRRFG